jgi:hypothetical protein
VGAISSEILLLLQYSRTSHSVIYSKGVTSFDVELKDLVASCNGGECLDKRSGVPEA